MIFMSEIGIEGLGRGTRIEPWDEISSADAAEALFDVPAFLELIPEEILPLGQFLVLRLSREDGFQCVGVIARVPGLCGVGHRRRGEVLHLFQLEVESFGDDSQFCHILLTTAWV